MDKQIYYRLLQYLKRNFLKIPTEYYNQILLSSTGTNFNIKLVLIFYVYVIDISCVKNLKKKKKKKE